MLNSSTYVRPKLYPKQFAAIFNPARIAIVEASTKSGKTRGCIVWLAEKAMAGKAGQSFYWIAPVYAQAKIAFRRMRDAFPVELRKVNESELTLTLPNLAVMWFKSADNPDSLYGDDVYAAVVDEATRMREEAWFALRSTLTKTQGPVRIIGNVKGRKNWVYNLARKAEAGEPSMSFARITANDAVEAGVLQASEIEDAKRLLPEAVFNELYMAQPSDDAGNPFGAKHIAACVVPHMSSLPSTTFGVDLAKSVDWTVIIGLDTMGGVSTFDRFQAPWLETIERVRNTVAGRPALTDSTGVGDPVLESLQRGKSGNFTGYKFSSDSKQKIMEGLAVAIQQGKVNFPDGIIRRELEAFEYEYTGTGGHSTGVKYSAPSGMHDDAVCALALAVHHQSGNLYRPRWRPA